MKVIHEEIKEAIKSLESYKYRYPKMETQDVINMLKRLNENVKLTLTDVGCSKLNEWTKIDPTKPNTIPKKPVHIFTIESKEIEYVEADDFIELNYASHYRLIDKPKPPL